MSLNHSLDEELVRRLPLPLAQLYRRAHNANGARNRNRELGHGAHGMPPAEFYRRMGGALLAGLTELLGRLDVLAGRRLVYVGEVRQAGGVWAAQRYELLGEAARGLPPLEVARELTALLPDGDRLYLEGPGPCSLRPLHPLLV